MNILKGENSMCKFAATREDLGNRLVGFTLYESRSKEFIGMD